MQFMQTHEAKKNPIKVKGLRVPNKNPLADTPEQIRIRINSLLISKKLLLRHPALLAIGKMNAKMITNGMSEIS
tara:strand:- start:38 stop:259 length:222 start_codon:yes stop_codon:yes gene_type:complete